MKKDECPICGWPYAFPELEVGAAYKKCMEIHSRTDGKNYHEINSGISSSGEKK